jgi:CheY-like chemotaxis protein
MQRIAAELLKDEGFSIVSASDGTAGLELVESCRPAVILLDLALPRMSGSEFLERIRGHSSLRHTPVIVITGRAESLSDSVTAQADCVLRKPFDVVELIDEVQLAATAGANSSGVRSGAARPLAGAAPSASR